jgi:phycobilisome rod-core linker protein
VSIPLLEYAPSSQNPRVKGFVVPGDAQARIFSTDNLLSTSDLDVLIEAAYRQIRSGQITVREFIRGLCLSNTFTKSFYDLNSNYRFVEQCVQRVLGRDTYSQQEKIAWSIVVATKGRAGFIDALLNSDEYLENFGDAIVPYQRRRVLPSGTAEVAFNLKSPRYDEYYRGKLGFPQVIWQMTVRKFTPQEKQAKAGDPSLYMGMARSVAPAPAVAQRVSPYNLDYMNATPYRKSK